VRSRPHAATSAKGRLIRYFTSTLTLVRGYEGERQHESKEYAQPELNPAIRLSLLGCINKRGAIIAYWPARLGRLIAT
jgi:hypothetical protein